MATFEITWTAKVKQTEEVQAAHEDEARLVVEILMEPRNVVELHDFEITDVRMTEI